MAAGGHFGWDDNVNYRTRPRYLEPAAILDVRNSLSIAFLAIQIDTELLFLDNAGGQFGCPKMTFDRISGHFRSILNFFVAEIFDKMAPGDHFGWDEMSTIELWMSNACAKFGERSLNPSSKSSR